MKVYRLEFPHESGGFIGPYNYPWGRDDVPRDLYKLITRMGRAHSWGNSDRHPPLHGSEDCSNAVRSMKDLFSWFGGYLPQLLNHGARIGIYEVDKSSVLDEDEYQVLYIREHAEDLTNSKENR